MKPLSLTVCTLLAACADHGTPAPDATAPDASVLDALVADVPATDASTADPPTTRDAAFDPSHLAPCTVDASTSWDALALRAHTPLTSAFAEQDTAFYVLTVLEQAPGVLAHLASDATLAPLSTSRAGALHDAATRCAGDAPCARTALVPDAAETTRTLDAVVTGLTAHDHLATVAMHLRASGLLTLQSDRGADDRTLVREALAAAVTDLTSAFDRYFAGELTPTDRARVLATVSAESTPFAWWQPLAHTVYASLTVDRRDEATRYGPLAATLNAPAVARVAHTDFSAYAFTAIVVPGQGPTDTVTMLDPAGRMRADLAAVRWNAHVAPFVLLSGGHVHPDRTVYSEAIEMRAYLMNTWHVPADTLLVDPYARHTTTNLRDATRVLLHAGFPADRPVLVVSDVFQSAYIASDLFATRCDTELGFRPWRGLQSLSTNDACFALAPVSLTVAASDALDP